MGAGEESRHGQAARHHLLDRRSPTPLWAQLAHDLRQRAAGGEFADRVDTEEELTEAYGVSRATVRQAIRSLESEGLIERHQGKGTYIASSRFDQPLHGLYSLASTITDQGASEHSMVRALRQTVGGRRARHLGLPVDAEVIYVERLRMAGAEPLALDRSWLPTEVGVKLLDADLSSGSLYEALGTRCGILVTGGRERIWPLNPAERERKLLGLPGGFAAFAIERLALAGDTPVEWRESIVRGDRYSFSVEWPSGAGAGAGAD